LATHVVQVLQSVEVQHICLHVAGGWLLTTTQFWKQLRPIAHCASFKHACVSLQQAPMMHWLHGVLPGSMVQLPESGGAMPQ
jgi:hypothetical protein